MFYFKSLSFVSSCIDDIHIFCFLSKLSFRFPFHSVFHSVPFSVPRFSNTRNLWTVKLLNIFAFEDWSNSVLATFYDLISKDFWIVTFNLFYFECSVLFIRSTDTELNPNYRKVFYSFLTCTCTFNSVWTPFLSLIQKCFDCH